jgi:FkbM family methyltransferase
VKISNVPRRIRQIASYANLGNCPGAAWNLAVLGFVRGHSFKGGGIVARLGRQIYPRLTVCPRQYGGLEVTLDPTDVSQLVIAEEFLQENIYDLSKVPFVPDIILDCGAHIGMFSLLSQARFPRARIKAFEPNPKNIELLWANVRNNKLDVEIISAAVSTRSGQANFTNSASCGGHLTGREVANGYRVALVDLKDHLPSDRSSRLLLKMDIEGSEDEVLPDVIPLLPITTAIFLETHNELGSWEACSVCLTEVGFKTEVIRRHEQFTDGFALRLR